MAIRKFKIKHVTCTVSKDNTGLDNYPKAEPRFKPRLMSPQPCTYAETKLYMLMLKSPPPVMRKMEVQRG